MNRRFFIQRIMACISTVCVTLLTLRRKWMLGGVDVAQAAMASSRRLRKVFLRPPGALLEKDFLQTCINCHRCGQACPNDCIKYINDPLHPATHDTPYINPREKACILCMKCTQACPSGSLKPIPSDDGAVIQQHVKMGGCGGGY